MLAVALSWLGRQGTRAVAALVVIGIALPPLGNLLRPFLTEAVFLLLCIAFARVSTEELKAFLRRPALPLAAAAWTSVGLAALFAGICFVFGVKEQSADLFLALILQGVASPTMAAPALTALLGLDATLVLVTLVISSALTPLTAPLFAHLFLGQTIAIEPLALSLKLMAILGGSALVGLSVRHLLGPTAIKAHKERIDGLNILVLFVFVAAIMSNVASLFLATPWLILGLTALAFGVAGGVFGLTVLVFWFTGRQRALALGFMASQRNVGLMLAATGGALPDLTWLYFALSQLPIYLSPQLIRPLVRHAREDKGR